MLFSFPSINVPTPASVFLWLLLALAVTQLSAKRLDPLNPCSYTLKTSRSVRAVKELKSQVQYAFTNLKQLKPLVQHTFHNHSTSIARHCKKMDPNPDSYEEFYRSLISIHRLADSSLRTKIDTDDNSFNYAGRKKVLDWVQEDTRTVVCELYDVMSLNGTKLTRDKLRTFKSRVPKLDITDITDLTDTVKLGICIVDVYENLIRTFRKYLAKDSRRTLNQRANRRRKTHKHPKHPKRKNPKAKNKRKLKKVERMMS